MKVRERRTEGGWWGALGLREREREEVEGSRARRMTDSQQQFCLRWNNFQANITSQFEALRDDEDFVDVTLACDGRRLQAHKVVLSACSPYFKELFKVRKPSPPCFSRCFDVPPSLPLSRSFLPSLRLMLYFGHGRNKNSYS